jgi:hypothetical protein
VRLLSNGGESTRQMRWKIFFFSAFENAKKFIEKNFFSVSSLVEAENLFERIF